MRTGPELVRASNPYAHEDRARTWRLLVVTLAVFAVADGLAIAAPWLPLRLVAMVVAGLTIVRLFIFYHDHLHGAVLADSPVGKGIMKAVGLLTLNPPSVWKATHDYHHKNNAKMLGASIGSFPVLTTKLWEACTPTQRRWYAFARHPLTMLTGYVTLFAAGMCVIPFVRDRQKHGDGAVAVALHVALVGIVGLGFGPLAAVTGVILPLAIACASGAYLFYAQHNFPGIELRDRAHWDYVHAALRCSSFFEMGPVMHWFTGNIGYHHVHHLNHRIPFYRLPEAMAALPELQSPIRTSWRPRDVAACLRLGLWDPEQETMIALPA